MVLILSSPVFDNMGKIPDKYTCKGEDVNPPLKIRNIPAQTKTLALIVDDPDAPLGTWVHWVVFNIDPTNHIDEDSIPQGGIEGSNDFGHTNWGGPCPPSGEHRYYFRLYALDCELNLSATATKGDVLQAMQGHVLEQAELVGLFSK
jgi:Raf kinase inhibitor-like YbhB/YbcL family protein